MPAEGVFVALIHLFFRINSIVKVCHNEDRDYLIQHIDFIYQHILLIIEIITLK